MKREKWYRWSIGLWWGLAGTLAWLDFFAIARETGPSPKWSAASALLALVGLVWAGGHLGWPAFLLPLWKRWQPRVQAVGWILWGSALLGYVYFFQYTRWGNIFPGAWLRLWLWLLIMESGAILATRHKRRWVQAGQLAASSLFSGTIFLLAKAFSTVSRYPFWLGWSEGNRIWDFSLLFGRRLYNYPPDQPIETMIDFGRQLLWGMIFLLPHPTIAQVRFWSALMFTLPLLLFGWLLFWRAGRTRLWFWAGLWAFAFLYQGPIYSQLIVSAILVTLAWQRKGWQAAALVFVAGYFAHISRWTWMFAPAIWIVMLELGGAKLDEAGRLPRQAWVRAAALGGSGVLGGYLLPALQKMRSAAIQSPVAPTEIAQKVGTQPLLWYRLLPNPTYPPGILLGLLLAVLPLLLWLLILRRTWRLNFWQRLVLGGALAAFCAVGLVVSTKIGGGSNLHNLDMFLVGLVFVAALAWRAGGETLFLQLDEQPRWVFGVLLLLILQPLWRAPLTLRPLELPPEEYVAEALQIIRDQVAAAEGEVLFMDHRQLLTFGEVPPTPLVPEYEKKRLMNQAMGADAAYFAAYYEDLKRQRFALIVSEPLRVRYQQPRQDAFAEENNAWVQWVAEPTLCYYQPIATLEKVNVQLLAPRAQPICELP